MCTELDWICLTTPTTGNDQYQLHFGMCCDVKNVFKFNVVIFYDQV